MRFHVIGLPHTQTTRDFSWCAYTQKVRRFCNMMMSLNHEVYLYAGLQNDAECTKYFVTQDPTLKHVKIPEFNSYDPIWRTMALNTISALKDHARPDDFLCLIGGLAQKPIADAMPDLMAVEFGVGYGGVFSRFKVFESYAWMHTVYGATNGSHAGDGNFFDVVIPNYFDVEDFPEGKGDGDYLLYIGRLIERKGVQVAWETAARLDRKLVIAGDGDLKIPPGPDVRGEVGPDERSRLMGEAEAVLAPTIYVEPFGGVAAEAMMCGTPVITTDWGAFTENVIQGVDGFRCRTLGEFSYAARNAHKLDRKGIRERAIARWSTNVVRYQYERYFRRLALLRGDGWYTHEEDTLPRGSFIG